MKLRNLIRTILPYGLIELHRNSRKNKETKARGFSWAMLDKEQELFKKYIKNSKIYLEFGSGGSTMAALINSTAKIYSVESSKDWINTMYKKYKVLQEARDSGRLNLLYVNIGETSSWGVPHSDGNDLSEIFSDYSQKIFLENPESKSSDIVLIDGRFRLACFFNVLLNTNDDVIILFHDFWKRYQYHVVLKYVDVIDGVNSLLICRKKTKIITNDIIKEYNEYKNDIV